MDEFMLTGEEPGAPPIDREERMVRALESIAETLKSIWDQNDRMETVIREGFQNIGDELMRKR
jgi:hypothetical protein